MSGHSSFEPNNAFLKWFEQRLPILGLLKASFVDYPTPRNLNYWWTFGGILSFMLAVQIVTGIVLVMHYTPHVDHAFNSVEMLMRDVNYGWLLRYLHANGASMFFVAVYIHMFRGLYYGSYKAPREILWILGVIIYLLMMATGFLGYTLPWGQMSYWGATVITNFFSAFPLVGEPLVTWLWGGYAIGNPTLQRFFSLHYLLPFVIAGVVVLHVWALHVAGQNNPTGIEPKIRQGHRAVHALRDHQGRVLHGGVLPALRVVRVLHPKLSRPRRQLHSGQSGRDAGAHRARMVLPAVLRHPARHPEQAPGRPGALFGSIVILAFLPWLDTSKVKSARYRPLYRIFFWIFVVVCLGLGWLGSKPAEGGYVTAARVLTFWYFFHFIVLLPVLGFVEKTKPLPNSISESVLKGKKVAASLLVALLVGAAAIAGGHSSASAAEGHAPQPPRQKWTFAGPFGTFDRVPSCSAASRSTARSARPVTACRWSRSAISPSRAARNSPAPRWKRSPPSTR